MESFHWVHWLIVFCAMGQLKKLYVCLSTAILHLLFGIVFRWLGLIMILTPNLSMLFECLTGAAMATSKNLKRGY